MNYLDLKIIKPLILTLLLVHLGCGVTRIGNPGDKAPGSDGGGETPPPVTENPPVENKDVYLTSLEQALDRVESKYAINSEFVFFPFLTSSLLENEKQLALDTFLCQFKYPPVEEYQDDMDKIAKSSLSESEKTKQIEALQSELIQRLNNEEAKFNSCYEQNKTKILAAAQKRQALAENCYVKVKDIAIEPIDPSIARTLDFQDTVVEIKAIDDEIARISSILSSRAESSGDTSEIEERIEQEKAKKATLEASLEEMEQNLKKHYSSVLSGLETKARSSGCK